MNILYLSNLSGLLFSGPTYSVPNQIKHQSEFDNVFWYNLCYPQNNIFKDFPFYHDLNEYPDKKIKLLPSPFNSPDLIVIEELYVYGFAGILKEVVKSGIPYIIVPRSQLTTQAQNHKKLKKTIGNILIYGRIIQNAIAIQYLSEQEKKDSISRISNTNSFVLSNGIDIPSKEKKNFSNNIKMIFIGRLEPHQKGLDLLIYACAEIREKLLKSGLKLKIIGPIKDIAGIANIKQKIIEEGLTDIIQICEPMYGEEKITAILDSDVFIMTSRFEGLPMGLLEALSYGLPCLVTKGTNMKDEVEQYDAGWTADNTVESIKKALLSMMSEVDKLEEKGKNAKKLSEQYDWNVLARKSHDFFAKLIEEKNV